MVRNPVMFVVEVGAVLSTVLAVSDPSVFAWSVVVWLWLTVVFANLAEAVAEGRGKAQAATLRRAKTETIARRLRGRRHRGGRARHRSSRLGDRVVVEAGEIIPGDGDVVEGVASVDESAITGESAPVIRESGGDRSSVTGGTKVLSDRIVVQITAKPGESFIDRMIALVEGAVAAEDAQRDRAEHPAGQPDHRVPDGDGHPAAVRDLLRRRAVPDRAGRAAGLPDPDHHRRAALGDRHRRHGPAGAAQRAGHVRPRGRGRRRREHPAAGQDRHHHPRQPAGRGVPPRRGRRRRPTLADAAQLSSLADETPEGRSIVVLAKTGYGLRERAPGELSDRALRRVHRADPDERRRPRRRPADPQGRRRPR